MAKQAKNHRGKPFLQIDVSPRQIKKEQPPQKKIRASQAQPSKFPDDFPKEFTDIRFTVVDQFLDIWETYFHVHRHHDVVTYSLVTYREKKIVRSSTMNEERGNATMLSLIEHDGAKYEKLK